MTEAPWPSATTHGSHAQRASERTRADRSNDHRGWGTAQGDRFYWFLWLAGPLPAAAIFGLTTAIGRGPGVEVLVLVVCLNLGAAIAHLAVSFSPLWRWRNPLHWCATAYFLAALGTIYLAIDAISRPYNPPYEHGLTPTGSMLWFLERSIPSTAALTGLCLPLLALVRARHRSRSRRRPLSTTPPERTRPR